MTQQSMENEWVAQVHIQEEEAELYQHLAQQKLHRRPRRFPYKGIKIFVLCFMALICAFLSFWMMLGGGIFQEIRETNFWITVMAGGLVFPLLAVFFLSRLPDE